MRTLCEELDEGADVGSLGADHLGSPGGHLHAPPDRPGLLLGKLDEADVPASARRSAVLRKALEDLVGGRLEGAALRVGIGLLLQLAQLLTQRDSPRPAAIARVQLNVDGDDPLLGAPLDQLPQELRPLALLHPPRIYPDREKTN